MRGASGRVRGAGGPPRSAQCARHEEFNICFCFFLFGFVGVKLQGFKVNPLVLLRKLQPHAFIICYFSRFVGVPFNFRCLLLCCAPFFVRLVCGVRCSTNVSWTVEG